MSPLNCNELHRIFKKLDTNKDGLVSLDELIWLLERMGIKTTLDELESLAGKKSLDPIDFWFFYDLIVKKNVPKNNPEEDEENSLEGDLVKAFKVFDINGDGFISCDELQRTLLRLGLWEENCGQDCGSMIQVYDTNSDGFLDFEEFKNMMMLTNS